MSNVEELETMLAEARDDLDRAQAEFEAARSVRDSALDHVRRLSYALAEAQASEKRSRNTVHRDTFGGWIGDAPSGFAMTNRGEPK